MLYVIHGSNTTKVADQAKKLVTGVLRKRKGAQVFTFEGEVLRVEHLDALIEAKGLFVEKHIIVIKQPYTTVEGKKIIGDRLRRFSETDNIVVLVEGKLLAHDKKKLEKHAHKIEEHAEEEKKNPVVNVFSLTDALGARKKQELWTGYRQALRTGVEPESIHGTLFWAVKTMVIAKKSDSCEGAGQKEYVYKKNRVYAKNFKEGELLHMSRELIEIYHQARRGGCEIALALERWILRM